MSNFDNDKPIYKQLMEQIQIKIITEQYSLGSKISSVRDLANEYKINPNTVSRALLALEDDKLIITDRTNGKYVTDDLKLIYNIKSDLAQEIIDNYYMKMSKLGFTKEEAIKCLKQNGKDCE